MPNRLLTVVLVVMVCFSVGQAAKIAKTEKAALDNTPRVTQDDAAAKVTTSQPRATTEVNWQVLSTGGSVSQVGTYTLGSTVGQVAAGFSTVGTSTLHSGFWQNWVVDCCVLRGDINHDGTPLDIGDLIFVVNYLFQPPNPAPPCEMPVGSGYFPEGDLNADGDGPDIGDIIYMVNYMFQPPSPAPIPCPSE